MRAAGDSHNFGRRVAVGARSVEKPRSVFWEWLVLGEGSPLRATLARRAATDGLDPDAFEFLPTLRFEFARSAREGVVERLELAPLGRTSNALKSELAVVVGRSLALFSWLGVADLHWENLALGRARSGALVFTPLDIEMALADFALPTETKLLPDADPEYAAICRHAAGMRRVLPFLGKPIRARELVLMAEAYLGMLAFLERNATVIARSIARAPGFRQAPIRVCLRGTDEYVRARSVPLWPPLLAAESEQLERGDIPYFFRLYGQPGIRWYANRALTRTGTLPTRGDVPQLEPLLSVARGLRSTSRSKLREDGLFALLGAFDHPGLVGRERGRELVVTFGARRLAVALPRRDVLAAPRRLEALVGSVYLGCRCGEVREVLVPPVTRCRGL